MKSSTTKLSMLRYSLFVLVMALSACESKNAESTADSKSMQFDLAKPVVETISANMEEAPSSSEVGFLSSPARLNNSNEQSSSTDKSKHAKDKKIIKDGSLSLKSKEIVESKLRLDALIKSLNGYYETENFTNDAYRNAYDLRIRVPSENFEKLLGGIEAGKEEVLNKNISARDVTEEYLDIETRLGTKRAYLQRYRELLGRAANVKEILEIEEQIRVLQEEIESQEGRLKFLSDQVAFSSLSVNLFTTKEFVYKPYDEASFFERMKSSFSAGWRGTVTFIVALASAWPLLLLLAAITIFGGKKLKNKFKSKTAANNK